MNRFDRALLGGLDRETFMARHWQRRPLLVRGAVQTTDSLPQRDALVALAARDDVESRVVSRSRDRWSLAHGPFDRMPRAARGWTLLVQGVNLVDVASDALMRRFDFVSSARLDDCMISYATDGGGVGAHVDSYDVFLVQLAGKRRWRWSDRVERAPALVPDVPLKLVADFHPDHEAVLEPGDLLYLPPHRAHEGTALGACTTASIGFRAPAWAQLARDFLADLADREWPEGWYRDRGRTPTTTPAALDDGLVHAIGDALARVRWSARDVARFAGRHLSEPKPHVVFERPRPRAFDRFARDARSSGLVVDRRAILLYRGSDAFIVGEHVAVPGPDRRAFRALADARRLAPAAIAALRDPRALAILFEWWSNGWIHLAPTPR